MNSNDNINAPSRGRPRKDIIKTTYKKNEIDKARLIHSLFDRKMKIPENKIEKDEFDYQLIYNSEDKNAANLLLSNDNYKDNINSDVPDIDNLIKKIDSFNNSNSDFNILENKLMFQKSKNIKCNTNENKMKINPFKLFKNNNYDTNESNNNNKTVKSLNYNDKNFPITSNQENIIFENSNSLYKFENNNLSDENKIDAKKLDFYDLINNTSRNNSYNKNDDYPNFNYNNSNLLSNFLFKNKVDDNIDKIKNSPNSFINYNNLLKDNNNFQNSDCNLPNDNEKNNNLDNLNLFKYNFSNNLFNNNSYENNYINQCCNNNLFNNNLINNNSYTKTYENINNNIDCNNNLHFSNRFTRNTLYRKPERFYKDISSNSWINRKRKRHNQHLYAKDNYKIEHPSKYSSYEYVRGIEKIENKDLSILNTILNSDSININNIVEYKQVVENFKKISQNLDVNNITVNELKNIMRDYGFNYTGKKNELIERIKDIEEKIRIKESNLNKNKVNENYEIKETDRIIKKMDVKPIIKAKEIEKDHVLKEMNDKIFSMDQFYF